MARYGMEIAIALENEQWHAEQMLAQATTPRQATRAYYRFMAAQLKALRILGMHLGMWGPLRENDRKLGCDDIPRHPEIEWACLTLIQCEDTPPLARHCFTMLLDFYHPDWRKDVGPDVLGWVVDRDAPVVSRWRARVLDRDGHQCQACGAVEQLHAHHIIPWADAPMLRLDPENGETLCQPCHAQRHRDIALMRNQE